MEDKMKREVLICAVQFDAQLRSGEMSVVDLAPIAAGHGARGVEYRNIYWKNKQSELPAVRDQLARYGLTATYATFTTLYNRDPDKRAALMQDLEDAHALGSPLLRVFRGDPPAEGLDDEPMRVAVRKILERSDGYGMKLALENHIGPFGPRLADVKGTIEDLNSPVLGTNVDIANYVVNGQDPIAAIHELDPWIIYAHLKDVKQTPEGPQQTFLGDGSLPLAEIVAALETNGRRIPLCFEFGGGADPEGAIARSMVVMESL